MGRMMWVLVALLLTSNIGADATTTEESRATSLLDVDRRAEVDEENPIPPDVDHVDEAQQLLAQADAHIPSELKMSNQAANLRVDLDNFLHEVSNSDPTLAEKEETLRIVHSGIPWIVKRVIRPAIMSSSNSNGGGHLNSFGYDTFPNNNNNRGHSGNNNNNHNNNKDGVESFNFVEKRIVQETKREAPSSSSTSSTTTTTTALPITTTAAEGDELSFCPHGEIADSSEEGLTTCTNCHKEKTKKRMRKGSRKCEKERRKRRRKSWSRRHGSKHRRNKHRKHASN